jgi:sugar/nucleoside kinase (ribokinase family)
MTSPAGPRPRALFAGLCTLDIIQSVTHLPAANEKVTALRQTVAAGGPATNAAVTFAYLGGQATLITGIGVHPLAAGIRADLRLAGVELIDMGAANTGPPPVSAILVSTGSGDRSVVSLNAAGRALWAPARLDALADRAGAVLVDAHHGDLALAAARAARARGRLCILDGGSWKDATQPLLPYLDVAICSADFQPPGTTGSSETLDYLLAHGVGWAAVTSGSAPIAWAGPGIRSQLPVPAVTAVDTLGAGDILHGAFAYAICGAGQVDQASFVSALRAGTEVAARSCQSFGTRTWMEGREGDDLDAEPGARAAAARCRHRGS